MEGSLFREKPMEELSSPDQLTSYLRVTGPGVWIVLVGIIVLLAGVLIWGVFGTLISTVHAPALVSGGRLCCYVLSDDIGTETDADIAIGDVRVEAATDGKTITLDSSLDPALFESGYLAYGKTAAMLTGSTTLEDGVYDAVVTTEKLKPISLLFSNS